MGGRREGRGDTHKHTLSALGTKPAAAHRRRPLRWVCILQCRPCSSPRWTTRLLSAEILLLQPAMLQADLVGV
ncbi:hypothetical protein BDA96_03G195500 [Sorghum bicolor]|uniref:Uncharacterized protein n=1 Tax=Sorghum bicolor TaxID=4558 RepID=A0A921RFL7_SORBI|nr:hypothetical protein BDA96_03G195500 [Sorghum bicolor]